MIIAGAFNGVDTFFFLSGFFLSFTVTKQKGSAPIIFVVGMLRRLIRTCVPLFFIIMCFYVLPLFVTGPDTKTFFLRFHEEVVEHWWHWLLQIKNFYDMELMIVLGHTWFLSADFQLFLVSFVTLLLLKSRKTMTLGAFVLLSLLSYIVVAWTLASDSDVMPFLILPSQRPEVAIKTVNNYYQRPFYHAMCYFSGCITFLIMEDFRQRKLTKAMRLAGWCVASVSMLCCIFMKIAWYKSPNPTSVVGNLLVAFSDRFLWSLFLAWATLVCSTGRGGVFARFLSCDVFVPLSKLSFGVYLIHLPFIELMLHASRERLFYSHFTQVSLFFSVLVWSFLLSYLAYLACEGPTSALEKLAFTRLMGSGNRRRKEQQFQHNEAHAGAEPTKSSYF
ncbi:nose resistant to fluoxetine protein 6-like [Amblyomma americanum]